MKDKQVALEQEVDARFILEAHFEAARSVDRSRKVGALIVGDQGEVLAKGVNEFPTGVARNVESRHARPAKYLWTEHAERNAIYDAARRGVSIEGGVMYVPWFPCVDCARAIVQTGISRLVAFDPDTSDATWGEQFVVAKTILEEGGVRITYLSPDLLLKNDSAAS